MYNFLSKNGQTIATVLGAVVSVAFILMAVTGAPEGLGPDTFKENNVPVPAAEALTILEGIKSFDFGFYITYIFLAVAVGAAIILSLVYFVTNFSLKSLRTLIPIIVMAIIFFAIYSSYNPDVADVYQVKLARNAFGVSNGQSQIISGAITTAIFSLAATAISLVVMEVLNFFK